MVNWHGYVLLEKPDALTMVQWRTVLAHLRAIFDTDSDAPQPSMRLHSRFCLNSTRVIVESCFDTEDLNIENLNRLARYISQALEGAYTPEQCRDAMRNRVTLWALHSQWLASNAICQQYLLENMADWELA